MGVERLHHVGVHLAVKAELGGAGAVPDARRFTGDHGAGVVALPALRHGVGQVVGVVAGLQTHDHQKPPETILQTIMDIAGC
nr:hypothetical protein [Pseudonocardia sediminis]